MKWLSWKLSILPYDGFYRESSRLSTDRSHEAKLTLFYTYQSEKPFTAFAAGSARHEHFYFSAETCRFILLHPPKHREGDCRRMPCWPIIILNIYKRWCFGIMNYIDAKSDALRDDASISLCICIMMRQHAALWLYDGIRCCFGFQPLHIARILPPDKSRWRNDCVLRSGLPR